VHYLDGKKPAKTPMFSSAVSYGNLLFIAGIGAHVEPFEIKAHTEIVLKEIEKQLKNAGSSMEKVLKVTVFLNDLKDRDAMGEVFQGRFGSEPPVRTTVAPAGGIPGNSLVEMDVIAYI
jgi:2-iminobutanoate/2-iminopropanoate deaminase